MPGHGGGGRTVGQKKGWGDYKTLLLYDETTGLRNQRANLTSGGEVVEVQDNEEGLEAGQGATAAVAVNEDNAGGLQCSQQQT